MPTLTCLHCHRADSIPRSLLGREVRCAACGKAMTAPIPSANPAPQLALGLMVGVVAVVGPWRAYRGLHPIQAAPVAVAEAATTDPAPTDLAPAPTAPAEPTAPRDRAPRRQPQVASGGPATEPDRPAPPPINPDTGGTRAAFGFSIPDRPPAERAEFPRPPSDADGERPGNRDQLAALPRPGRAVVPGRFPAGARARALRAGSTGDVAVAREPRAVHRLRSPYPADRAGYGAGPMFFRVAAGTRVEVLDSQRPASLVRVAEGAHEGQEGWLADEWLQPLPDPNAVKGRAASLLTMARNLDKAGKRKQAAEAYRRVASECPGTPEAGQAEAAAKSIEDGPPPGK